MKTAIFIYELGQIGAITSFLSSVSENERESCMVVALGADIEFALREHGIPFQSGRGLRSMEHIDFMTYVEKIGREVLDDPTFSFFSYRGVKLTDIFMPILQLYLLTILYFIDVLTTLAETYPQYKKIVVFPSTDIVLETAGILAPLSARAATDAARVVGEKHAIEIVIPAMERLQTRADVLRVRKTAVSFYVQRRVFGWALALLNMCIAVTRPAKGIRILASDYWKHISPLMKELPEGEVLLLDRAESFRAGLAAIWKYRMQFIHIDNFLTRSMRKNVSRQVDAFVKQWKDVRHDNAILHGAGFKDITLAPLIEMVLQEIIIKGGKQAVSTIDGTYALCEKMRPDIVLVRASVSGQIHFAILCSVARQFGIPSVEIQHGLFYLGQSSFINRPAAEYVATYGFLASEGLKRLGYTDERLFNIGSPRFDAYKTLREKEKQTPAKRDPGLFTVTCIVPAVLPQSWSDSYEIVDYLSNLASAVAHIPNVFVIFKLRPIADNEFFFRKAITQAFGDIPYKIAQYEPFIDIIAESNAIITIYSTTVLEGLISGRPLVYNGTLAMHDAIGKEFIQYAEAGALIKVKTPQELKTALESLAHDQKLCATQVERADAFIGQNYSFDGTASRQLAERIRALKTKKKTL